MAGPKSMTSVLRGHNGADTDFDGKKISEPDLRPSLCIKGAGGSHAIPSCSARSAPDAVIRQR